MQRLYTPATIEQVISFITANAHDRRLTLREVLAILHLPGHPDTLRRSLALHGYHRRVAVRRPWLSPAHRVARLRWALDHVHWTQDDWRHVIRSDEAAFYVGDHRRQYVTRPPGEELHPDCLAAKLKTRQRLHGPWSNLLRPKRAYCLTGGAAIWRR